MSEPDVSVVVVTYRSATVIADCLESVYASELPLDVTVVENASGDRAPEIVRERFPDARVIENDRNRGFGAAVNQGAAGARGRYLVVVNPDARLAPGALARLVEFLDRTPEAAGAGPSVRNPDGSFQAAAARVPRLRDLACAAVPRLASVVRSYRYGGYTPELYERGEPFAVDAVLGVCMALRRDAFDGAGGFDERFFMYMEEIDLCLRLPARVYVVPDAVVYHEGAASSAASPVEAREQIFYEHMRSQLLFFAKHRTRAWQAAARALGLVLIVRIALQALVRLVREPAHRKKWRARLGSVPTLAGLYLGVRRREA